MSHLKWTIGEVEIYQLVELECGKLIQSIIKNAQPENIRQIEWLTPHFADEQGNLKAQVQSFPIKSEGKNILIDTCSGNDKTRTDISEWSDLQTDFIENLVQAGVTPEKIDIVACTHLHCDHVGWNTKLENGKWIPTFPNAMYLFVKQEYEYWLQKPAKEIADDKAAFDDSVTPIVNTGLVQLVVTNHHLDRNVRFLPTPGHTPAHVSVLIESRGKRALISGDVLHHPCQIAHLDWNTDADTFPEKAMETRKKVLQKIGDTDTLLIGSHFANPVAGKIIQLNGKLMLKV